MPRKATLHILFILFSLCYFSPGYAQKANTQLWLKSFEELAEEYEMEDYDWEEELLLLDRLQANPINLNRATREELKQLPFLSDEQIEQIHAYLYLHGEMKTLNELLLVEGMDKRTMEMMLPFVCIKTEQATKGFPSVKNILKYGEHELITRLDQPLYTRKGYSDKYLGTKQYHSLRYDFSYGDYLHAGITAEKDAGEPLLGMHNKQGYDHYGAYVQLKRLGRVEHLAVGNYRLNMGEGLILGSSFNLGRGTTLANAYYKPATIRKHSSTDEYNYFSGVASTVRLHRNVRATLFYSYRNMDATIKEGKITSIYKTGLHRSESEAEKVNAFSMQTMGGSIRYDANRWSIGANGIYYFFDKEYRPNLQTYSKYNLQGNHFYNVGMDYQLRLGALNWRGEVAKGKEGWAAVNRLIYNYSGDWRMMLVHRYYAHDYWSFFGNSFGDSSTPQNENGWYLATEATPFARWRLFASIDLFSFQWWKYRISKPSQGMDVQGKATYTPTSNVEMYVSYRYRKKERDVTGTGGEQTYPYHHHKLRYRLTWNNGCWQWRSTIDYNRFKQMHFDGKQGWGFTQACNYVHPSKALTICIQGSYFNTDDYDSRVYIHEKGLLHTFYTPAFQGRGFRYLANVRYDMGKRLMLLLKFGETIYQNRETIGSGSDLINSNRKADVQIQVRLRL